MNKSKLSAILSLTFVFASGLVLGGFAYRLYFVSPVNSGADRPNQQPMSPERKKAEGKKHYIETLTKKVKLDADQLQKLNGILEDTEQEINKIRERHKAERDALNAQTDAFRAKVHPEFEVAHNHQVAQINAMLRDDQKKLYKEFQDERDRQRKLREQQQQKK
jgi:molecular chaperone DnaK (HSP70)